MYTKETAKTYVGIKTLLGWPMTRGYLVEYLDNPTGANHPNHENYISWSPANVFEGVYKEVEPQRAAEGE